MRALLLLPLILLAGCGGTNVSDRVTEATGTPADCEQAGVMLLVGEREKVYVCTEIPDPTYPYGDEGYESGCYAIVDGSVVDVTLEAVTLRAGFGC